MSRFFKTTAPTFVDDKMFKMPVELATAVIQKKDANVNALLENTDSQKVSALDIKHSSSDIDTYAAKQIEDAYMKEIEETARFIKDNPLNSSKALEKLRATQTKLIQDRASGNIHSLGEVAKQEELYKEGLKTKNADPENANKFMGLLAKGRTYTVARNFAGNENLTDEEAFEHFKENWKPGQSLDSYYDSEKQYYNKPEVVASLTSIFSALKPDGYSGVNGKDGITTSSSSMKLKEKDLTQAAIAYFLDQNIDKYSEQQGELGDETLKPDLILPNGEINPNNQIGLAAINLIKATVYGTSANSVIDSNVPDTSDTTDKDAVEKSLNLTTTITTKHYHNSKELAADLSKTESGTQAHNDLLDLSRDAKEKAAREILTEIKNSIPGSKDFIPKDGDFINPNPTKKKPIKFLNSNIKDYLAGLVPDKFGNGPDVSLYTTNYLLDAAKARFKELKNKLDNGTISSGEIHEFKVINGYSLQSGTKEEMKKGKKRFLDDYAYNKETKTIIGAGFNRVVTTNASSIQTVKEKFEKLYDKNLDKMTGATYETKSTTIIPRNNENGNSIDNYGILTTGLVSAMGELNIRKETDEEGVAPTRETEKGKKVNINMRYFLTTGEGAEENGTIISALEQAGNGFGFKIAKKNPDTSKIEEFVITAATESGQENLRAIYEQTKANTSSVQENRVADYAGKLKNALSKQPDEVDSRGNVYKDAIFSIEGQSFPVTYYENYKEPGSTAENPLVTKGVLFMTVKDDAGKITYERINSNYSLAGEADVIEKPDNTFVKNVSCFDIAVLHRLSQNVKKELLNEQQKLLLQDVQSRQAITTINNPPY